MTLQERVQKELDRMGIDKSHYQYYLTTLNPLAIAHNEQITNEQIHIAINVAELFWGLGEALINYLEWEREQI